MTTTKDLPTWHSFGSAAELRQHYAAVRQRLTAKREIVHKGPKRWSYAPAPLPIKPIVVLTEVEKEIPAAQWKVIVKEVAKKHGLLIYDLTGPSRAKAICRARQEACYRLHHETTMSLPAIGRRLGGRDHTTVLHSIRRHAETLRVQRNRDVIAMTSRAYSREDAEHIIHTVAAKHGVTVPQITGDQHKAAISAARDEAIYLCSTVTGLSHTAIARLFGDRNPSTISRAVERYRGRHEFVGVAA